MSKNTNEINENHTGDFTVLSTKFKVLDTTDPTKVLEFDLSGITAGATSTFAVPDADGTFVTLTGTQSLTNKGMDDTTTTVFDTAAPTKQFRFEAGSITAGQTRVVTVPDSNGTVAYLAGSTLTTATLTAPTINAATLTGTLAGGTFTGTTLTSPAITGTVTSAGGVSMTTTGGTGDFSVDSARNILLNAGATGYIAGTVTDGDITFTTNGAADDIILAAASNGSDVYINSGLRLDRNTTATSASTSWRSILGVTDNSAGRTITLEADTNVAGHIVFIKDEAGTAGTANAITITPESGTIDGAAGASISQNYGAIGLYGTGTNWFKFFDDSGLLSQGANATLIGAVAAPVSGTTAVKITRMGPFFTLTFTLTAARIAVTDDGASGAYGATKLFDFVEGGISFLGCRQNYTAYTPDGTGVPTDDEFVIGLGTTAIVAAADAVLAAGNQNVGASIAQTLVAGTTTGTGYTAANSAFDGSGTAADLYLNWSGDDVTTDGNGTIDVTGTITVVGTFLGDD